MDSELAAVAYKRAPAERGTIWKQRAVGNVLERWEEDNPEAFDRILYSKHSGWLLDITNHPDGLGPNGWDTNFEICVDVDDDLAEQADVSDAYLRTLELFGEALEEELVAVIGEEQEQSQFAEKEFVAFILYQHHMVKEAEAADALGITVGTYRGKLGRIREKIDAAKLTMQIMDEAAAAKERWEDSRGYRVWSDFVSIHESDEYPATSKDRDGVLYIVQNKIDILEYEHDRATYDGVIDATVEEYSDEAVSRHRARYELERAIDNGVVERDGDVVTRVE